MPCMSITAMFVHWTRIEKQSRMGFVNQPLPRRCVNHVDVPFVTVGALSPCDAVTRGALRHNRPSQSAAWQLGAMSNHRSYVVKCFFLTQKNLAAFYSAPEMGRWQVTAVDLLLGDRKEFCSACQRLNKWRHGGKQRIWQPEFISLRLADRRLGKRWTWFPERYADSHLVV